MPRISQELPLCSYKQRTSPLQHENFVILFRNRAHCQKQQPAPVAGFLYRKTLTNAIEPNPKCSFLLLPTLLFSNLAFPPSTQMASEDHGGNDAGIEAEPPIPLDFQTMEDAVMRSVPAGTDRRPRHGPARLEAVTELDLGTKVTKIHRLLSPSG